MTHEHHDTVVTDGGGGTGAGMIIGIVVAVLIVLALIWYFGFAQNPGNDQTININPPEVPAEPAPPDQPVPYTALIQFAPSWPFRGQRLFCAPTRPPRARRSCPPAGRVARPRTRRSMNASTQPRATSVAHDPRPHRQHVGIVVLAAEARGDRLGRLHAADAADLVGDDLLAGAAAAEHDAQVAVARGDRPRGGRDDVGVVDRLVGRRRSRPLRGRLAEPVDDGRLQRQPAWSVATATRIGAP